MTISLMDLYQMIQAFLFDRSKKKQEEFSNRIENRSIEMLMDSVNTQMDRNHIRFY